MHYTPLSGYSLPERNPSNPPVRAPLMSAFTTISPVTGELMVPGNAGVVIQADSGKEAIRVGGTAMTSNMTLPGLGTSLNQIQFYSNGSMVSAFDQNGLYFPDSKGVYFGNADTFGALAYSANLITLMAPTTINLRIGATNVASITSTGINGANLLSNATNGNLAVGANAFAFTGAGSFSTSIGVYSGNANMTGGSNTCVGYSTGLALTNGYQNTLLGNGAGTSLTSGAANQYIGFSAGRTATTGVNNVGIGVYSAGSFTGGSSGGDYNVFVGAYSGERITTGYSNVCIGETSGKLINSGYANTIIGRSAGTAITSGYGNIIIGHFSAVNTTTGYNNIYIGQNCVGSAVTNAGEIVIGDGASGRGTNTAQIGNIFTSTFGFGSDTAILNKVATTFNSNLINVQNGNANGKAYISLNYGSGIYFHNPAQNNNWVMEANSNSQFQIYNPGGGASVYLNYDSSSWLPPSDRRLKENIKDIEKGLDIISQLQPVHFQYIKRTGNHVQTGFIANDVQHVLPYAVHEIDDGMLGLDLMHILPYAVQAIKELNEKIEKQSQLIGLLMAKIESRQ